MLPVLAACMLVFAVFHVVRAQQTLPKPPPPVEPARTPFGKTVAGAGIAEAVTENISIGAALPGVVLEVYVPVDKVGKVVEKDEPLFLVDNRGLKAQLKYAQANLKAAEAQLAKLDAMPRPEEVPPSEAAVAVADAQLSLQQDLVSRANQLAPTGAMSTEDIRQRSLNMAVAKQQLSQATANLTLLKAGAWDRTRTSLRPPSSKPGRRSMQTETDLERCWCAPRCRQGAAGERAPRRICRHAAVTGADRAGRHRQESACACRRRRTRHSAFQDGCSGEGEPAW